MRFVLMKRCVCVLLMLTAALAVTSNANAQGYNIEYLDSWPTTGGMKFIRVRITPVSGAAKDDLDFYAVAKSATYQSGVLTVSTVIPVRKGDASATGELYVPGFGYNHSFHVELDGNLREDRKDFAPRFYDSNYYVAQASSVDGVTPTIVFASSAVIADDSVQYTALNKTIPSDMAVYNSLGIEDGKLDLDDLNQWYSGSNAVGGGSRTSVNINGFSSRFTTAMSLESLPSKWFAYEGIGILVITMDDMKLLSKNHPGKLLAIERWVAASGRLVVLNCGSKLEKTEQVLELLGDSNQNVRENRQCTFLKKPISNSKVKLVQKAIDEKTQVNGYSEYQQIIASQAVQTLDLRIARSHDTLRNSIGKKERSFISVGFQQGEVIAVSDEASDWGAGGDDRWIKFALFLKSTRPRFSSDHRVLNEATIRDFGFPEFDEPPRYFFEFSIVLYLLAVGPLAFFVLKRRRQLNLMFVVVPVISALCCTTILGYAVFAEGFDTRVNLFTVTSLDQRSGRQATSSVAHIYSGLTPSPYRFDGSSYGLVNFSERGRALYVNWGDNVETVSGGEIRARTNHQLFARTSNESESKAVFSFSGSGDSATASVRNELGVPIAGIAFISDDCDATEAWYCGRVEVGQTSTATKMKMPDITSEMKEIVNERSGMTVFGSKGNYRPSYGGNNDSSVEIELMNAWRMNYVLIRKNLERSKGTGYMAITDEPINYEMPVENAKIQSQFHVVKGIR